MEKQLFQNYPKDVRREHLHSNCNKVESLEYRKQLSDDDIQQLREDLEKNEIEHHRLKAEFDEVKKEFKEKMKPSGNAIEKDIIYLRDRSVLVTEECFVLIDEAEGRTGYYNADGELVYERPMSFDERQRTIQFNKVVNQ